MSPKQARSAAGSAEIELLYLPGLESVVAAEARQRLARLGDLQPVPGRADSLAADYGGAWRDLLALQTIVAPFIVLHFDVPRPRSLTSGEYFPRIMAAVRLVREVNREPPATFRLDAAGSDSAGYRQLAAQLQEATGLPEVSADGQLLLRFRRSPAPRPGWDVLVRLSSRPLSSRPWRVRNFPGAANATVAAAMSMVTEPAASDRVVNLMCGSGTLIIERLCLQRAAKAVALDADPAALAAAAENLDAAGFRYVNSICGDIRSDDWLAAGPFDVLLADPPWGTLIGEHAENEALHMLLLERAYAGAAPAARMAVLTHEIRIMERCLRQFRDRWRLESAVKVFQKGHHPRIYLFTKR